MTGELANAILVFLCLHLPPAVQAVGWQTWATVASFTSVPGIGSQVFMLMWQSFLPTETYPQTQKLSFFNKQTLYSYKTENTQV